MAWATRVSIAPTTSWLPVAGGGARRPRPPGWCSRSSAGSLVVAVLVGLSDFGSSSDARSGLYGIVSQRSQEFTGGDVRDVRPRSSWGPRSHARVDEGQKLSLIHISEPTRQAEIS